MQKAELHGSPSWAETRAASPAYLIVFAESYFPGESHFGCNYMPRREVIWQQKFDYETVKILRVFQMKRNLFALSGLLATSLFAVAQIPATAQEMPMTSPSMTMPPSTSTTTSPSTTMRNVPRPDASLIDVQDQSVPDGKLFVKQADAPSTGWLVVRENIGGRPGAVLGYVPLNSGMNKDLTVPLRALPSSGTAIVSVHSAPNGGRTLSNFNLTSYPLAKGGNKSALTTVTILPNSAVPAMPPSQ
jgi:hypothetical protein